MTYFQTRSNPDLKYKNIPQFYNGIRYDSKKEARKAWELDLLIRAGEVIRYETHKSITLTINGKPTGQKYKIDFIVYHTNGLIEYLEVKSKFTARGTMGSAWKSKWSILESMLSKEIELGTAKMTVEY